MAVLDEEGRLFGTVNVVDAFVVVLVGTTLLAGLVFVGGATDPTDTDSTGEYATVAVHGDEVVVQQVVNGTELTTGSGTLVVTDRARVVRPNGSTATVLRVRRAETGGLLGGEESLSVRPGDRLRTRGTFDGLGLHVVRTGSDASLATRRVGVVARATTDAVTATDAVGLARGGRANDGPVRVTRADIFPEGSDTRRLRLGLSIRTLTETGRSRTLRTGTRLPRAVTPVDVSARITAVGRTSPPGSRVDRRVTVQIEDLAPSTARTLHRGDRTVATTHPATVRNVTVEPATLLVTDAEGRVHERPHPRLRAVTLTLSVPARRYGGVLWYQGERLQVGDGLTLDTGRIVVSGNVTAISSPDESPADTSTSEALTPPGDDVEPGVT